MIIRCPSCSTRFDLPASRFDADGTMIKCSVCGHDWIEARAVEVARESVNQLAVVNEPGFEADFEIRRLVDATRDAQESFAAKRKRRQALMAAWLSLGLVASSPVALALAFPETVVKAAPATISLYQKLGKDVNIYGLAIRRIDMQHMVVDGKRVIAIKGEIANISSSVRKIPWLRFGLKDPAGAEVYTWQLDTNARPLNPGENTNFVTRIASPPETAGNVEIRFARAEELGSTTSP
jgi:predicted Zn finger-like uncharacterized protein